MAALAAAVLLGLWSSAIGAGLERRPGQQQPSGGLPNFLERSRQAQVLTGTFLGKATAHLPEGDVPYVFVQTFHADGTCESNTSFDLLPPAASPARGEWERVGDHRYVATEVGTLINSVTDPTFFGTFKVRQLLTTNAAGDEIIEGQVKVDIFDAQGNLVFSFDATGGETKRIKVEPPQ